MNLKGAIDVDALRAQIDGTGKQCRELLEGATKQAIEQLEAAASTMRELEGMATGELLERAVMAEVIPVAFGSFAQAEPGLRVTLQRMQIRVDTQWPNGSRYDEHLSLDLSRGHLPGPTVKAFTRYRLLMFLLEQKP